MDSVLAALGGVCCTTQGLWWETRPLLWVGNSVDWATIPRAVTPMNRIIVATPRGL